MSLLVCVCVCVLKTLEEPVFLGVHERLIMSNVDSLTHSVCVCAPGVGLNGNYSFEIILRAYVVPSSVFASVQP